MKKLTPREERNERLISFGISNQFLSNIGKIDELEFLIEDPKGAYFYFPTMDYKIFSGFEVTPIFDSGETFYALFEDNNLSKIVKFELENDKIYFDYGQNWKLLLLSIMINLFDQYLENEISKNRFIEIGNKIGFEKSSELFDLRDLPVEELNKKFEDNEKWELEIAEKLKIL
ncbi:hypothetical protein H0I23_14255 [Cellulophaga sp. HaHaR_3_176]|uniref:hypothetical protein n=1 Tax=Cellulophaga sp. HaHaR_3_176 TaxID=1942464 RepID=UPI001C1F59A0|nr:hypothetical protein [Cellulophaga sp. HaHaR_3_176]QWX83602.1 hypothetical protein H0I23_14255 [Cellulophaga sp. HaHaR_3_176]